MNLPHKLSTMEIILQKLESYRKFTAHELAVECGLAEPVVRYHLRKLCVWGVVQVFPNKATGIAPGRKAPLYRIVDKNNRNVDQLCSTLLHHITCFTHVSENDISSLIAKLLILDDKNGQETLPGSIKDLIDWLNNNNYQASWEAGSNGPIVKFSSCPFRDIRAENNILCQVDLELLRLLNGQSWEMTRVMDWMTLQGSCQFIVKAGTNR